MKAISFITLVFISNFYYSQTLNWAENFGGAGFDQGNQIVLDDFGNSYITGAFQGVVDFDPSGNVFNLTSNGVSDVFVQKLNSNGDHIGVKRLGGTEFEYGSGLAIDTLGDIYAIGYFDGTVDFDPNIGTYDQTSLGSNDIYICKLDFST